MTRVALDRYLTCRNTDYGWPTLGGPHLPLLVGSADPGINLVCGCCRAAVLASSVHERQVLGVLFVCGACGGISSADREPGEPVPATHVGLRPRRYNLLSGPIVMNDVITIVGLPARDAYRKEAGYRPLGTPPQPSRALSASSCGR